MNYFEQLNGINVNDHVEKKNTLSYLSWPYAWAELKKLHPTATYTIYENDQGWNYHTDGRTAWVKTGVTVDVDGTIVEHIEELPVMDYKNRSIPLEQITSFDVNKAIQRSLTKAVARHGLGLYIYAGEDLPEAERPDDIPARPTEPTEKAEDPVNCMECGRIIKDAKNNEGKIWRAPDIANYTLRMFHRPLCITCMNKELEHGV